MLQDRQRGTLFQFLNVVRKILSEYIDQQTIQQIESELNLALALLERHFPIDIQVCTDISDDIYYNNCLMTGYNNSPA